ncbi:hypothetical protein EMCRGX_G033594 [Ephydatia muelleri]
MMITARYGYTSAKVMSLYNLSSAETVICHADLETAPLLVLANKQDRMDALPLTVVEAAFGSSEEAVGNRDYRIQRVSALKG